MSLVRTKTRLSFLESMSITNLLVIVNILIFLVVKIVTSYDSNTISYIGLSPNLLFNDFFVWTLITSVFMHANIFHLFVNMFSLFFVGRFLEMIVGRKRFFWLYIASGVFAGIFFALFSYIFGSSVFGVKVFASPNVLAMGASGAIFGIAGVLSVITPRSKVSLMGGPILAIVIQAIINQFSVNSSVVNIIDLAVTMYIFVCIFSMFSRSEAMRKLSIPINMNFSILPLVAIVPLFIIGYFLPLPIGNMAHLGGYLAGAAYGVYLKNRYKNKVKAIGMYFK
ncbi:MAG: rhomboid family intramembrane serine protease [Nanoarchaeota archaeon]